MDQTLQEERKKLDDLVARLQAELTQAQQQATCLAKAQETYDLLAKRVNKLDRLPRHICADVLPLRYSTSGNTPLKSVPIAVFVALTRYLTKTEIEALIQHNSSLSAAVALLATPEIHVNWYRCFEEWKKSSDPRHLRDYFTEITDAIIALNGLQAPNEDEIEMPSVHTHGSTRHQKRRRVCAEATDVSDRETPTPEADTSGTSNACTNIDPQHQHTPPTYVDYTFAYMFKTQEMFSIFSEPFMARIQSLATWGTERTTSCIRAHMTGKKMEFVFDWELPTAPPVEEILSGPSQATVNIKHVTQLCLCVPYEEGQHMLNLMTGPAPHTRI
ncbi:hypothetical protein CORC01_10807 [Colletotrichum orchidophilum]|uniref:Uncharacterized protein n=1 Tax=Colletotrichum orchidophilum TaxID=1209926 RepID=A0A1G4AXL8_9PEZI|nr:uncharacterized protein CORC01_10807 [Colletotrichum orchidophilum]OHE93908.1 hypothetical protein CORC01_10807 [Colletotrichum orchidophilum]